MTWHKTRSAMSTTVRRRFFRGECLGGGLGRGAWLKAAESRETPRSKTRLIHPCPRTNFTCCPLIQRGQEVGATACCEERRPSRANSEPIVGDVSWDPQRSRKQERDGPLGPSPERPGRGVTGNAARASLSAPR